MEIELSPNLCAWIAASHVSGQENLTPTPAVTSLPWLGLVEESRHDSLEIDTDLPVAVKTLRLFSELLRSIGGFSEPLQTDLSQELVCRSVETFEQSFHNAIDQDTLGRYSSTADLSWAEHELRVSEEYEPTTWYTVPAYINRHGTSLPNLFRASYLFKDRSTTLAGVPHDVILCEDSALDFHERLGPYKKLASVKEDLRVYRIESEEDFTRLVEYYPTAAAAEDLRSDYGEEETWIEVHPDWKKIAKDFNAVSIDCNTYLTASWRALPTSYGLTRISGWVPESLYLLSNPQGVSAV